MPFHQLVSNGKKQYGTVVQLKNVAVNVTVPARDFARPQQKLNGRHGDFVAKYVMAGGPADRAGLKVGDVITAVNGEPATTLTLSGLRGMLRNGTPESRVKLVL